MNLVIYVNENFEDERALFDKDKEKVMLKGDEYHDKIDEKIEGYLQALADFAIYQEKVETEYIDESNSLYKTIGFESE